MTVIRQLRAAAVAWRGATPATGGWSRTARVESSARDVCRKGQALERRCQALLAVGVLDAAVCLLLPPIRSFNDL